MILNNNFYLILILLNVLINFNFGSALTCINCNSNVSLNCAEEPSEVNSIETCGTLQDSCITAILSNNHTYRGCKPANLEFQQPYESCITNSCNNKEFPSNRLKCIKCAGANCVLPNILIKSKTCIKYKQNDLCYTSIVNNTYGYRGCVSEINDTSIENIEVCGTNGCNNETGIIEIKCGQCDSLTHKDCVRSEIISKNISNTGECKTNILRGQNIPACFTYHRLDRVIRDCYINKDRYRNLVEDFITTCSSDYCNKKSLPILKCVTCGENTSDPDCILNKIENCKNQESSCYSCSNLGNRNDTKRGCGSNPYISNCYQCQENGCNIKTPKYCYKCSSHIDPNCANLKNVTILPKEICETSDTSCLIGIDSSGFTIRQCAPANINKMNFKDFEKCSGQLCNDYVFPIDQQQCFICNGTDECNIKPKLEYQKPCSVIRETNKCYEFKRNSTNNIVRGCSTDSNYRECTEYGENCLTCLGRACNNRIVTLKESKLSCNKCISNVNNNGNENDCRWTQNEHSNSTICSSFIPIDKEEFCYYVLYENNTHARGCSWDDQICTNVTNNNLCKMCNENNCNKDVLIVQHCIQKENVTDSEKDLVKEPCPSKEQYFNNQGCYVYRNGTQITWGCISDIPSDLLTYCNFEESKCNLCKGSDCDQMKAPNKSTISTIFSNFPLFTIIILSFKMYMLKYGFVNF
ncbi:uncharacterized protein LOC129608398 [Condylostylus longicornis]|uniref:uncharacterized protein LOC129608398 n=1 Tax=Condylostylus longicornis TaxID=2530218 RepID=UPI00244DB720|nr:uncharacterized protein LOC129608398 [Condylostylus longicornis]